MLMINHNALMHVTLINHNALMQSLGFNFSAGEKSQCEPFKMLEYRMPSLGKSATGMYELQTIREQA